MKVATGDEERQTQSSSAQVVRKFIEAVPVGGG
jgi:hypothetical protein